MATNESWKIGVFLWKKILFVTLPFQNGLKYQNANGHFKNVQIW